MVISGKFTTKQAPLSARLGSDIGKGLGDQIPKEMQQYRLQEGLKKFAEDAPGLSPLQAYAQAAGIPGIQPQALQSLPEIVKQQQLAQSLGQNQNASTFPSLSQGQDDGQPSTGLTTRPGIEALRNGYIEPTAQQIDARAAELYNSNPGRFKNDPQLALRYAEDEAQRERQINQDFQKQREGQKGLQRDVEGSLQSQSNLLGVKVPGDVYSDIRERAVRSVIPKSEGGEGLTDEEAKIKYGKELDAASRDYEALNSIGSITWASQSPKEMIRNLNSTRDQFKKRGDLRNYADKLISTQGLSPSKAYHLAYPNSDVPNLQKTLGKLPDVNPKASATSGFLESKTDYNPDAILNSIVPTLASNLGNQGSPLSVAEDLQAKGYDPDIWLNYLSQNKEKLDLTLRQIDELSKPRHWFPNLSDIWLFKLSGQDKLLE
jgi:hypothetical protein